MDNINMSFSVNLESLVIAKKLGLTQKDLENMVEDGIQSKLKAYQEDFKQNLAKDIELINKLPRFNAE